jgi:hypothetical protein
MPLELDLPLSALPASLGMTLSKKDAQYFLESSTCGFADTLASGAEKPKVHPQC